MQSTRWVPAGSRPCRRDPGSSGLKGRVSRVPGPCSGPEGGAGLGGTPKMNLWCGGVRAGGACSAWPGLRFGEPTEGPLVFLRKLSGQFYMQPPSFQMFDKYIVFLTLCRPKERVSWKGLVGRPANPCETGWSGDIVLSLLLGAAGGLLRMLCA